MSTATLTTPSGVRPSSRPRRRATRWISTLVALVVLVIMLFPVYWMLNTALQPDSAGISVDPFPTSPSLANFADALSTQGGNLLTSLAVALGAVLVCLAIAAPAAYGLAQFDLPAGKIIVFATLITQMVPGIVIANALYSAYVSLDLVNSWIGLILADASLGIPFAIVLLRAFMVSIPKEVVEAAEIDGASKLRAFVSVVLPMSRNALITAGLFAFLYAWSDFLFALTLNTTDQIVPITLGIYNYIGAYVADWGAVMAAAVLSSLPALVLLVVAQRYIAAGITGGSSK